MRLRIIPPAIHPDVDPEPTGCPAPGCGGRHLQLRQTVRKPLRNTVLTEVPARRDGCLRCGRTCRVSPRGVGHDQTSARLKGVAAMFYVLEMSYGAAAKALAALGFPLSKVAVYNYVQAAGAAWPGRRRAAVRHGGGRVVALGAHLTGVRWAGSRLTVGVGVVAVAGLALTVDGRPNGEAATLTAWVGEGAAAVGAEVLVGDGADAFETAADDGGLDHQLGTAQVVRNTEAWVRGIAPGLAADADGSLAAIGVEPEQAVADARGLLRLMEVRDPTPEAAAARKASHGRDLKAAPPRAGAAAALAYWLRPFSLDRRNRWRQLTRYRSWEGPAGERLDGPTMAARGPSGGGSRSGSGRCGATSGRTRSATSAG